MHKRSAVPTRYSSKQVVRQRVGTAHDGLCYCERLCHRLCLLYDRAAKLLVVAVLAGVLAAGVAQSALAQDGFYRGKTVTIVVGYSAGGGYDQYARLVARYLGRHIPGQPSVIVQNMPGAASMTSVRYLDANAAKDGTVITAFDPGLVLETIAAPEVFKVRFSDFRWVGTLLRDIRVCYASVASGIKTWQEMMARKEFLIGNTARGSNAYVNGAILRKVFHAPVRQISGYPGSNEQRLALERGELEGNCGSWTAIPQDWIVNSRINALLRFSRKRPADMPASVPFVNDLASTQEQKDLLDVLNGSGELGRPFIVAKGVPGDRVVTLRAAFEAMVKDESFLAEAQKQSLLLDPVSGAEAEKIVASMYAASPALTRKVKDVLE
jgi:tripartite-type tricarboxylate transporter receptor subunit TctC